MSKPMTYAESQNGKVFDWHAFLDKGVNGVTAVETEEAADLASDWVTCACGQQCSIIPRYGNDGSDNKNMPIDKTLRLLGMSFYNYILGMHYNKLNVAGGSYDSRRAKAKDILADIEFRSGELIKKLTQHEIVC